MIHACLPPYSNDIGAQDLERQCDEQAVGVDAVAQKSPCERKRVLMGKESLLKHSQRGQDARQEVPMRTPKPFYAQERMISQPALLACHARQPRDHLAQMAPQQGGLLVALDGWAPPGGEPHRWCIRALSSGLTVRSGWRCQPDQPTGAACLAPRKHLAWPVLAGRS